jgi:hypothetical protein
LETFALMIAAMRAVSPFITYSSFGLSDWIS